MDGHKGRRAGRIDGHAWAVPVEKVRDAVRDDGTTRTRCRVRGHHIPVSAAHLSPVVTHEADVHGGAGAAEAFDGLAGRAPVLSLLVAAKVYVTGAESGGFIALQ